MKKPVLILLLIVLCLLLCSCRVGCNGVTLGSTYTYADADRYTAGDARVNGRVEAIDINWLDGTVQIGRHSGSGIILSETSSHMLTADTQLHWRLDGATLYVKYAASGYQAFSGMDKQLTLLLPEGIQLDNADISVASADVQAEEMQADTVRIQSASGSIKLQGEIGNMVADAASGSVSLTLTKTNTLTISTASGDVQVNAQQAGNLNIDTASGDVDVALEQAGTVSADTASGSVSLRFARVPERIGADTVSGSVTILLPDDAGFTAELDSISGAVNGSLPMTHQGDERYVNGDERCQIHVNTVSGSIHLNALTGTESWGR